MGDRGNIGIHQPEAKENLYLYTHWSGSYIPETLALGLAKCKAEHRLGDPAYATRIIFDTLTGLEGGSTGYGIGVGSPCDNEHEIPMVYWSDDFGQEPVILYLDREWTPEKFIEAFGDNATENAGEWSEAREKAMKSFMTAIFGEVS